MFRSSAQRLAKDPKGVLNLMARAAAKARQHWHLFEQLGPDFQVLTRMVRAYANGRYRKLPWASLVMALAAVLYFVNPLDLVPDFLFGIGLVDDMSVLAFALATMRRDLGDFQQWEHMAGSESGSASFGGAAPEPAF